MKSDALYTESHHCQRIKPNNPYPEDQHNGKQSDCSAHVLFGDIILKYFMINVQVQVNTSISTDQNIDHLYLQNEP